MVGISELVSEHVFSGIRQYRLYHIGKHPAEFTEGSTPVNTGFQFLHFDAGKFAVTFNTERELLAAGRRLLYLFRIFGRDGEFLLLEGAVGLQIFLHHSELFPISFRYFLLSAGLVQLTGLVYFGLLIFRQRTGLPRFRVVTFPTGFLPGYFILACLVFIVYLAQLLLQPLGHHLNLRLVILPLQPGEFLAQLFRNLFAALGFFLRLVRLLPFGLGILILTGLDLVVLLFGGIDGILQFFRLLLKLLTGKAVGRFLKKGVISLERILVFLFCRSHPVSA